MRAPLAYSSGLTQVYPMGPMADQDKQIPCPEKTNDENEGTFSSEKLVHTINYECKFAFI
jgi:hypothetical protein